MPAVSVIIPARNEQELIQRAVRSVLEQEYYVDLLECIVVNNASTDNTASLVREAGASKPAARLSLAAEPVLGIGRTKNKGAESATGEILVFMDADSWMAPNLIREVANHFRSGYRTGSLQIVSDGRSWIDRAFFWLMELGKVWFGVRAQMLYCERSLFESLGGFNEELRLGEDVDLLTRASRLLRSEGERAAGHVTTAQIATSPRRLAESHHLGALRMFWRWLLAFVGFGRQRPY